MSVASCRTVYPTHTLCHLCQTVRNNGNIQYLSNFTHDCKNTSLYKATRSTEKNDILYTETASVPLRDTALYFLQNLYPPLHHELPFAGLLVQLFHVDRTFNFGRTVTNKNEKKYGNRGTNNALAGVSAVSHDTRSVGKNSARSESFLRWPPHNNRTL